MLAAFVGPRSTLRRAHFTGARTDAYIPRQYLSWGADVEFRCQVMLLAGTR